jgi:prevent-host-death family protein
MSSLSVTLHEAKAKLAQLLDAVETGAASEIVISRHGKPAARLMPVQEQAYGQRLGLLEGRYSVLDLDMLNQDDSKITHMFSASEYIA